MSSNTVFIDLISEYMGLRYHVSHRITCSTISSLQMLLYMATTMVGPALAIEAVQGLEMWKTVVITGTIATFYTTLGGMKAVIWADVFQFLVIVGSLLTVAILGTHEVGGLERVWNNNDVGDRLKFFNFSFDPTDRLSFFGLTIGIVVSVVTVSVTQPAVQRYIAAKSLGHARGSLLLTIPFHLILFPVSYFNGLVLYAFYNNKQTSLVPAINSTFPPLTPDISLTGDGDSMRYEPNYSNADQILMYFVSSQFGRIPGMQGLFVACLFAGALSTISSGLNGTAACFLQDIVKPWRKLRADKRKTSVTVNDAWDTKLSKILSCVFGVLATLIGFLVPYLGSLVVISNIVGSVFGGPIVATFVMGMFLTRTNSWGAFTGLVFGFALGVFISAGPIVAEQLNIEPLPIQRISFIWYSAVTFTATLIVGVVVSEIARCIKPSLLKRVDSSLLILMLRRRYTFSDDDDYVVLEEDGFFPVERPDDATGRMNKTD
ncbi:sodium-dependent multivitamin transporter-like isoform X2 [Ptychodera flava]|uniref:sodium-dependent multivitamin transporter-like isoform X2 n=1 Tax=Ptychodera flava TaxID=63121 RepID=UPI00396A46BE